MTTVVDDHILLAWFLTTDAPPPIAGPVATTGLWYHRLCRAALASQVTGSISRQLGLSSDDAVRAARKMSELPSDVELIPLRTLAAPMAQILGSGLRLNLASLEALAAAEHLDARICLAEVDANPPLVDAARRRGIDLDLIPT